MKKAHTHTEKKFWPKRESLKTKCSVFFLLIFCVTCSLCFGIYTAVSCWKKTKKTFTNTFGILVCCCCCFFLSLQEKNKKRVEKNNKSPPQQSFVTGNPCFWSLVKHFSSLPQKGRSTTTLLLLQQQTEKKIWNKEEAFLFFSLSMICQSSVPFFFESWQFPIWIVPPSFENVCFFFE